MYIPTRFKNDNILKSFDLIRSYPLATLISCHNNAPFISHVPLVLEVEDDRMVVYGHLARANPHSDLLSQSAVTAVFMGPQAYITPTWFTKNDVPTWNYMTVHLQGKCEMMQDRAGITECLKKLTGLVEDGRSPAWDFWIPEDLADSGVLEKHIVGFRIEVENMQSKFKLGQSYSAENKERVIAGLSQEPGEMSQKMAQEMRELFKFS